MTSYEDFLRDQVAKGVRAVSEAHQQWTLGQLIDALEVRPADQGVCFDFCGCVPRACDSYRGYYDQLALGWIADEYDAKERGALATVGELLADLKAAIGKTFTGYKGGEFVMSRDTMLWVANCGRSDGTAVVGLHECSYTAIILTRHID